MKNVLFIALAVCTLAGCANNNEVKQILVGKWKYDPPAIVQNAHDRQLTQQQIMAIEGAMLIYQNYVFEFQEDNTLILSGGSAPITGTYELNRDGSKIALNLDSDAPMVDILEISPNRVVLAADTNRNILFQRILKPVQE